MSNQVRAVCPNCGKVALFEYEKRKGVLNNLPVSYTVTVCPGCGRQFVVTATNEAISRQLAKQRLAGTGPDKRRRAEQIQSDMKILTSMIEGILNNENRV